MSLGSPSIATFCSWKSVGIWLSPAAFCGTGYSRAKGAASSAGWLVKTSAGEEKCTTKFLLTIGAAIVASSLFASSGALAACPVGKDEGDTWCDNGTPWKCERCGSEYCSIIQPGSCLKDDVPFNASDLSRLIKRADAVSPLRYAEGDEPPQTEQSDQSAGQDLENAAEDGQEAVEATTDEDAKVEAGETFDTPHNADGD